MLKVVFSAFSQNEAMDSSGRFHKAPRVPDQPVLLHLHWE